MKQYSYLLLIGVVVSALLACGGGGDDEPDPGPSPYVPTPTPEPVILPLGNGSIESGRALLLNIHADWNASTGVAQILNKPSLATVATTGNYSDLNGAPSLAPVAPTGDYDDLSNKPTIPAAQVNADWNATSGVAEILNKPTIPVVPSMKNLVAGSNITITDSANSVTIAATVPVIGTITV